MGRLLPQRSTVDIALRLSMTALEEEYVHLAACVERLQNAWMTLHAIQANKTSPLVGPAFRFALVEYATLYTASRGQVTRKHKLDASLVPVAHFELHKRILAERDSVHAHTDLTVRDARLYFNDVQGKRYATVVSNYVHGLEELNNLEQIVELVEGTLDNMFEHRDALERAIPPKPCI